jgi:hypothetical protein
MAVSPERDPTSWLNVYSPLLIAPTERRTLDQAPLLDFENIGMEGIAAWLARAPDLGPLVEAVAESPFLDEVAMPLRLFELASSAEGLHRRIRSDHTRMSKGEARKARRTVKTALSKQLPQAIQKVIRQAVAHIHEPTYADRLRDLVAQVEEVAPGLAGFDSETWIKYVKDARNSIAHQLEDETRRVTPEQRMVLYQSLHWLLLILVLAHIGVSSELLGFEVQRNDGYYKFRLTAKAWLPELYSATPSS